MVFHSVGAILHSQNSGVLVFFTSLPTFVINQSYHFAKFSKYVVKSHGFNFFYSDDYWCWVVCHMLIDYLYILFCSGSRCFAHFYYWGVFVCLFCLYFHMYYSSTIIYGGDFHYWNCFDGLIENHLTMYMWAYFYTLFSILLIYLFVIDFYMPNIQFRTQ